MPSVIAASTTSDFTEAKAFDGVTIEVAIELASEAAGQLPGVHFSVANAALGSWDPIQGPEPFWAIAKPLQHSYFPNMPIVPFSLY